MWGRGVVTLAGPGKSLSPWNFNPRQSEVVLHVPRTAGAREVLSVRAAGLVLGKLVSLDYFHFLLGQRQTCQKYVSFLFTLISEKITKKLTQAAICNLPWGEWGGREGVAGPCDCRTPAGLGPADHSQEGIWAVMPDFPI